MSHPHTNSDGKDLAQLLKFHRFDDKFLQTRKVFLWGMVNDHSARHVIDRLLYLDAEAPGEEISLFINSPGGYVTAGMAILDTMNLVSSPVATYTMGHAASMGSIILSAGEKGRRFVTPYAEVMIHQPSGGAQGTASDIEISTEHILRTRQIGAQILADNCGHPVEKILKDFNRDYWMNAEESVAYGIVDGVVSSLS
ncbi:MAG: ATP-dependent Clp protease proteolytic subunit [Bacteroidota bacterium]